MGVALSVVVPVCNEAENVGPLAREICVSKRPSLDSVSDSRKTACHFPEEVKNV